MDRNPKSGLMQLLKDLATILDIPYGTIEKRSSGPANNYYNYLSSTNIFFFLLMTQMKSDF